MSSQYAKRINSSLVEFFKQEKAQIPASFQSAQEMIGKLQDFCTCGGKRLRPTLVYFGYELLGGKDNQDILKVSLSIELIHSFLLIHDDIMDEAFLRRGRATIHKLYEKEAEKLYVRNKNFKHFGETMAILVGDLSSYLALKLLLSTGFSPQLKVYVLEKLCQTIINTIFGQELDIRLEMRGLSNTQEILNVYRLKTAQYSFVSPLQIGAILKGGSKKDLEAISDYAIPCGIAFQIKDDILGMFGDEKKTGKPIGADLKQGKQTLLIAKALQKASTSEKKKIKTALGNRDLDDETMAEIRQIIRQTGSLAACEKLAKKYISQAKKALKEFSKRGWNKDVIKKLDGLADFIVERRF